jgi:hypothetical protein
MPMRQNVLELRVDFTVDLADMVERRIGAVYKAIGRWAKPGKHGKMTITFIVITNETSTELTRRLNTPFEKMGCVENYWCGFAPKTAAARNSADPYIHWLEVAWKKVGERPESYYMRKA